MVGGVPDSDSSSSSSSSSSPVSDDGGPFSQNISRYAAAFRSATEVTQSFQSSYESRLRFGVTLADCELVFDVQTVTLTIKPGSPDIDTVVNLDEHVGNIGGALVWHGSDVKFSQSCSGIRLEGALLRATCTGGDGGSVEATLDLNMHLTYVTSRHCFEVVIPDRELTQFMSSSSWMNFAVITRPDIFTNAAFQKAVKDVAQSSVNEVKDEMKQAMELVIEQAMALVIEQAKFMLEHAMKIVSSRSEQFVQSKMDTLIRTTANAGAFYGLGGLEVMNLEQRRYYNAFAPYIKASLMPEN
ncbi:hypothetical protein C8R44DRAFT_845043 [Mycena epipterygia]|nr:hypothetical protein C8R44DRAFT_845043 [Mycena epipterygia]